MALSYRTAFVADLVNLVAQALVFAYVGELVDGERLPSFGGVQPSYLSFVVVGLAITGFLQVGLGRLASMIRSERMMGTLEAVLMTPTKPWTLQLGWMMYDVLYVPLRTLLFLGIVAAWYALPLAAAGIGPALLVIVLFLPFVWGLGVLVGGAALVFRRGGALTGGGVFLLTLTSGAYFPLELLPRWAQKLAALSPLAVAVESARRALIGGEGVIEMTSSLVTLGVGSVATLFLGVFVFHRALAIELDRGLLGQY